LLKSKKGEPEKRRVPEGMMKCPECAELVKKEARVCRFCGYEFYKKPLSQEEEIEKYNHEGEKFSKIKRFYKISKTIYYVFIRRRIK
jgi:hypothetical protein